MGTCMTCSRNSKEANGLEPRERRTGGKVRSREIRVVVVHIM